jgi:hypothetical protein
MSLDVRALIGFWGVLAALAATLFLAVRFAP